MNPRILQQIEGIISDAQNSEKFLLERLESLLVQYKRLTPREVSFMSVGDVLNDILDKRKLQESCGLYDTPWTVFNEEFDGFHAGELVIIGGRPCMGKSNILQHLALHWTRNRKQPDERLAKLMDKLDMTLDAAIPTLYYCPETSREKATLQLFARAVNKPRNHFINGDADMNSIWEEAREVMANRPLYINDRIFETFDEWMTYLSSMIENYGVRVILIDYIQMLSFPDLYLKRHHEVTFIMRQLKELCKQHKVLIVATSQMNRLVELRNGERKPTLSDLSGSSGLEEEADKVILLYRASCYGFVTDMHGNDCRKVLEMIVAKNRSGSRGNILLSWNDENGQVTDPDFSDMKWKFSEERMQELRELNDGLPF